MLFRRKKRTIRHTFPFFLWWNILLPGKGKHPMHLAFFPMEKYFAAGKKETAAAPLPFPYSGILFRRKKRTIRHTVPFFLQWNILSPEKRKHSLQLYCFRTVEYFPARKKEMCSATLSFPYSQIFSRRKKETIRHNFPFFHGEIFCRQEKEKQSRRFLFFRRKQKTCGTTFPFPCDEMFCRRNVKNAAILHAQQSCRFLVQQEEGLSIACWGMALGRAGKAE